MADILWDNDNDLPALDLFDATVLPPLDGFTTSPLLSDAGLGVHFPEPSLEPELPGGPPALAPPEAPSVNLAPEEAPEFSADDLLSIPTPPSQSNTPADGSVDDEFFSERGFSGNSSNHEVLPPTTSLSSTASDLTTGMSAVELAKRKAEQYANDKASDRKRKNSAKNGGNLKRQKKGAEGSSCSDGDNDEDDDAPEKVSHRKYQKRLQKNRDSAYVSRIRRREYARILEDSLERTEKEKNALATRYDVLQRKFDVIVQELNTLKEATAARFGSVANSISAPVGAASMSTAKPKTGAIVTTMFMFALMFGCMVPGSLNSKSASPSNFNNGPGPSFVGSNFPTYGPQYAFPRTKGENGKVWRASGPPEWTPSKNRALLQTLSNNVTQLFGKERAGRVMELLEGRIEKGIVSEKALMEIAVKAQWHADNIDDDDEKPVAQSKKSAMFQSLMRRLAAAADECFTKELVALLTVRLIPQPGKQIRTI